MAYTKHLDDYVDGEDIYDANLVKPSFSIGEAVRNASYHSLDQEHVSNQQRIVLESLLKHPDGLTNRQIHNLTGISISSVCARRNELKDMGLILEKGIKRVEADQNGNSRLNTVYVASFITNNFERTDRMDNKL